MITITKQSIAYLYEFIHENNQLIEKLQKNIDKNAAKLQQDFNDEKIRELYENVRNCSEDVQRVIIYGEMQIKKQLEDFINTDTQLIESLKSRNRKLNYILEEAQRC